MTNRKTIGYAIVLTLISLAAILFRCTGLSFEGVDYLYSLLPCMHERYNYLSEMLLAICSIGEKKYRFPALLLLLASAQCYGQSYLAWPWVSHYALAAVNIAIYLYLTGNCMLKLYQGGMSERKEIYAENRA